MENKKEKQTEVVKTRSPQEEFENTFDEFDFIKCHDLVDYDYRETFPGKGGTPKRIRNLKNNAKEALKKVMDQAIELEQSGKPKYGTIFTYQVNRFLALAQWVEPFTLPHFEDDRTIWHYEEQLHLNLYYVPLESGTKV